MRIAIRNSLILNLILWIPEKMHMGIINVVSNINKIDIPSTPNWKLTSPSIQFFFSINWNYEIEGSKKYQRKSERKKLTEDVKIATYFEFFSTTFCWPFITKINNDPISGINIIEESIGKFI